MQNMFVVVTILVSVFFGLIVSAQPDSTKGYCQYSINGRNMTLSKKTEFPTEFCVRLGDGIRSVMQAAIYDATFNLGSSLERFGPKDVNRSIDCNISVFDYRMPLPLMSTEDECHRLQSYVNLEAEVAAYRHLDTIRRSMGLPDDDDASSVDGPKQTTSVTPRSACEFGPYGIKVGHWLKGDCDVAQKVFTRCTKKHGSTNSREAVFHCFTDAITYAETNVSLEDD